MRFRHTISTNFIAMKRNLAYVHIAANEIKATICDRIDASKTSLTIKVKIKIKPTATHRYETIISTIKPLLGVCHKRCVR